jgi:hypothetical protein
MPQVTAAEKARRTVQPQTVQRWRYAMGWIELTPTVLKVDYAGRHETVLRSEITSVTRKGGWPAITARSCIAVGS